MRNLRAELVTDPAASNRRQAAARQRAAEERESRVLAALAVTEELLAQQTEKARKEAEREAARMAKKGTDKSAEGEPVNAKPKERPKEPRASTTDAQARVMKMPDGGFRPAYNVQFASDTKSGAIAGVSVDNIGSDKDKMAPDERCSGGRLRRAPQTTLGRWRLR